MAPPTQPELHVDPEALRAAGAAMYTANTELGTELGATHVQAAVAGAGFVDDSARAFRHLLTRLESTDSALMAGAEHLASALQNNAGCYTTTDGTAVSDRERLILPRSGRR